MNPIIPTVFAHNKIEFEKRFRTLIKISNHIQIDFMDGKFVSSKSINLDEIPNLKNYKRNFEAHMMVRAPEKYIDKLKKKGFSKVIFHIESIKSSDKTSVILAKLSSLNLDAWIALNPDTSIDRVLPFLSRLGGVLLMGVQPGEEHQELITEVLKHSKNLRKITKSKKIQLDGGVNSKNIVKIAKSGINYVNSGSYISESKNPLKALKELNYLFKANKV